MFFRNHTKICEQSIIHCYSSFLICFRVLLIISYVTHADILISYKKNCICMFFQCISVVQKKFMQIKIFMHTRNQINRELCVLINK